MRWGGEVAAPILFGGLFVCCVATPVFGGFGDCGQPVSGGIAPVATDALFALAVAVGTQTCDACVCDVDSSGGSNPISATDALIILRRAVDPAVEISCIECSVGCDQSEAPECGGLCPDGGTCAPEPTEPENCSCLGSCELGPAPVCGGACDGPDDDPSDVCTSIVISIDGGEPDFACICIPDGIAACEDTTGPECQGVCHPGSTCEEVEGACVCVSQPEQGGCGEAAAPACGGICGEGEICAVQEDACACAPWNSNEQETCNEASVPTCGGTCGGGRACAVDIGEGSCECLSPCGTGEPPSCGGSCVEPGQFCAPTTITLDGSTLEYCDCVAE
jgi:hypothetical protein